MSSGLMVDLDSLFESLVRDYAEFGLSKHCSWTRYTTEYIHWFAQEGRRLGYHVDQEVEYTPVDEFLRLHPNKTKLQTDLVWVTDPKRDPDHEVFVLHLESETKKARRKLAIDLVAYSPLRPLPAVVACLYCIEGNREDFSSRSLDYAKKIFRGKNRKLLLLVDTIQDEGDPFYGYIVDGSGEPRKRRASCVLHKWQGAEYFGLDLEE